MHRLWALGKAIVGRTFSSQPAVYSRMSRRKPSFFIPISTVGVKQFGRKVFAVDLAAESEVHYGSHSLSDRPGQRFGYSGDLDR
jgi:hypothetical protein